MPEKVAVFWFRRDLRLEDNTALYHALKGDVPVLPLFIFDKNILEGLPENDARVSFIYRRLLQLRTTLQESYGSAIAFYHGNPVDVFRELLNTYELQAVYTNRDYEPYARKRDQVVRELLEEASIPFYSFKDQVIFEKEEVVKEDGGPYVVYTPYMRKWKECFEMSGFPGIKPSLSDTENFLKNSQSPDISLADMGFRPSGIQVPEYTLSDSLIASYQETREYPADAGTSRLGPHLRFGTVSVRQVLERALRSPDETFWNELIWREFFMQILWHFPKTVNNAFRARYDRIAWRNDNTEFELWKQGKTGFPLVDAGMRQLNATGYMHNRVRMLVASFLCKHLLIDWRWGEAYFAEKLLDYELSSNVGNWQWAAGSGVDAAPYFRIFNPMTQQAKFDKDERYIREWIPEYGSKGYPEAMVVHKEARERCLQTYKKALE